MITIISGTNRPESVSLLISNIYKQLIEERGENAQIIDLKNLPADFIQTALYGNSGKNEEFNTYRETMKQSQKMVFVVAEYNGSFPGVLKAFIDGLIFPSTFTDKKAALIGISSGVQGAGLALSHLTDIFNYCGMHVLAQKPKLSRIEENLTENKLSDLYHSLLVEQVDKFLKF
ncbi:MAG: NAD(P)H-dependent oxidoreductase [Reichenbachiella sp.]